MIRTYIISDRNVVGLLLLLRCRGRICSSDMLLVNSDYGRVNKTAHFLMRSGLLEKEIADDHRNKIYWTITETGKVLANITHDLEYELERCARNGKVL
ncbi:MAG: hypothetical protein E7Z64_07475 [Thermoplasmata archaeon]|nr:hypothetical protein [Thermoplasmata archaeon]